VTDTLTILRDALSGTYGVEREIGQGGMATVRVQRHYQRSADAEFTGEQGMIRAFAWGGVRRRV